MAVYNTANAMISVTERAKDLVAERPLIAHFTWCIRVTWHDGDVDVHRSNDGAAVWTKSEPRGWLAEVFPLPPQMGKESEFCIVSGVKVWIDINSKRTLGAVTIDERDGKLFVAL